MIKVEQWFEKLTEQRKRVGSRNIYRCSRRWDGREINTTGAIDLKRTIDLDFVGTKYIYQVTWRAERGLAKSLIGKL